MVSNALVFAVISVALTSQVSAHIALWHPSMLGYNQSSAQVPHRPMDPLYNLTFKEWWMHDHLDYLPHPEDILKMAVGGKTMVELACDKGATSYYQTNPGGDSRDHNNPDYPCTFSPLASFHTNGINDLGGCALSVAYKSNFSEVTPDDLVIFSVNHTCVWNLHTYFEIPKDMPPCPDGKCICAWHWIHLKDSGSEQMYMNGFQCNFTGATSTQPLAKPQVARLCGAEPDKGLAARPQNCTYGAKAPFYWLQQERCNTFEDYYSPPTYRNMYNFLDGAQNDIFVNSTVTTPLPPSSATLSMSSAASTAVAAEVTPVPTTSPSSSTSLPTTQQSTPKEMCSCPTHTSESEPVGQSTSSQTPTIVSALAVSTTSQSSSPSLATTHQSPPNEMSSSPTHTSESNPVGQTTSSQTPTIVGALAVSTISQSSSPSVATTQQSPPNEMSPSPAQTSGSKPSQSDASSCHHQKRERISSHNSRDFHGDNDIEVNSGEQSVRRAWSQHRRAIDKRHV